MAHNPTGVTVSKKPTQWSLKNQSISNYGTIANNKLTTITPQNPKGFLPLEVPSTIPLVSNLYFAIDTKGNVRYAQVDTSLPSNNPNFVIRQFNNIQEVATTIPQLEGLTSDYSSQTTELIKTTISNKLKSRTDIIITKGLTEPSPYVSPGGGANPSKGTPTGGSSSGFTAEQSKQAQDIISVGVKARTQYASSSELKYPSQYDGNDYLTITMLRYVADPNLGLGKNPNATGEGEGNVLTLNPDLGLSRPSQRLAGKKNVLATISLPIPANLVDQNPVGWGNGDITALEAYGAGAAARLMSSGLNVGAQAGAEVSAAAGALRNNKDAAKTLITSKLAAQIIGIDSKNLLSRSTGAILNPNLELLFNGPSLRMFNFSFKMTPRDQKEAIAIRKIIRTLKQGMAPKSTASGIFLAAPNIFELEFKYVDPKIKEATAKRHPFLPVLKPCALQNLSVNYMPDGSYMTYGDGSMIAYDMTCTFAELEPIFDQDYDELEKSAEQDSLIGY